MASDLSAFVEDLKRDPELALTADLSDEELLDLQRMLNPYARIAGPARDPARPRAVAVSYTNLRED